MLIRSLLVLVLTTAACSEDTVLLAPEGKIRVVGQAAPEREGGIPTASLGLMREDSGELVFCVDAGPGEFAGGVAEPLGASSEPIVLQLFAFSEPGCQGIQSSGSADRYRALIVEQ